jgi:hypothetical protein
MKRVKQWWHRSVHPVLAVEVAKSRPLAPNTVAADPDGREHGQPPSDPPDEPNLEETDAQEAGEDDELVDAGNVPPALAELGIDGLLRRENGDDE